MASLLGERGLQAARASGAVHMHSAVLPSSGAQAQGLFLGMWDLLGSGIKPLFLALGGGLFTTEPPGKPNISLLLTKGASLMHYSFINLFIHSFTCSINMYYYFTPKSILPQRVPGHSSE